MKTSQILKPNFTPKHHEPRLLVGLIEHSQIYSDSL